MACAEERDRLPHLIRLGAEPCTSTPSPAPLHPEACQRAPKNEMPSRPERVCNTMSHRRLGDASKLHILPRSFDSSSVAQGHVRRRRGLLGTTGLGQRPHLPGSASLPLAEQSLPRPPCGRRSSKDLIRKESFRRENWGDRAARYNTSCRDGNRWLPKTCPAEEASGNDRMLRSAPEEWGLRPQRGAKVRRGPVATLPRSCMFQRTGPLPPNYSSFDSNLICSHRRCQAGDRWRNRYQFRLGQWMRTF